MVGTNGYSAAVKAYGEWVVRWRWPVLVLTLAAVAVAAFGAQRLAFKNDYRMWFSKENPQLQAFEELQNVYTKNDNILFVLEPAEGGAFTPPVMAAVEALTAGAWRLPYAIRVDSVTNFQFTRAEGDDLVVRDLIEGAADRSPGELLAARQIAAAEPALYRRLTAADGRVTGVNVTFQMPEKSIEEVPETAAAARELKRDIESRFPGISIYMTGVVMMNTAFAESSRADWAKLIPLMILTVAAMMLLLLRSITGTVGTLLIAVFSVLTAMGLAGWMGFMLSSPLASAPIMILTLAVADSVHLMVTMLAEMQRGLTKRAALVESIRINFMPIFLTSITTAVGFLTMNFSDAPPFQDLGNVTAMGVMAAFLYSVTFTPAFLAILPVRAHAVNTRYSALMDRFADFVIDNRSRLLAVVAIMSVALLAAIPRIELNDEFVRYFDEDVTFRADTDFINDNLTGSYRLHYSVPAGESNGIADPGFLARLDAFAGWLLQQPEVVHVSSISDTFKRLNRNMHGDDPAYHRIPENRQLAAQYLLLYELSLPFGLDLNNQLNIDKSSTQVVATLTALSSRELRDVAERGQQKLAELSPAMEAPGIGTSVMFSYISERNIKSMLLGVSIGLVVISAILVLALRSLKIGLMSLIPNLLPAGLAFGLWGLLVGQVNMAVSVVAAMTLGIVVDDTVHFLSKYLRARRERGLAAEDSVRYAFATVGVALVVTTMILAAGFAILAQSSFEINAAMAQLTAIAIAIALVVDFLLLPPLLMRMDRGQEPSEDTTTESSDEAEAYAPSG